MPFFLAGAGFRREGMRVGAGRGPRRMRRGELRGWWGRLYAGRCGVGVSARESLIRKCGVSEREREEVRDALVQGAGR